jgi:hypothetical protein
MQSFLLECGMTSKLEVAGNELFDFFQTLIPSPLVAQKSKKRTLSQKEISSGLESFYAEVRNVRIKYRLGIIARARLVRFLQIAMLKAGYDGEMVRNIIFSLILSSLIGRAQ